MRPPFFVLLFLFSDGFRSQEIDEDSSREKVAFDGMEHWDEEFLDLCDNESVGTVWHYRDASCYLRVRHYEYIKIEVVAWEPTIVILRDVLTKRQLEEAKNTLTRTNMTTLGTLRLDGGGTLISTIRVANGTFVLKEAEGRLIYEAAKRAIPALNLTSAEKLAVISYHPGGHYAPHFDFIDYESPDAVDELTRKHGNRFATFIMILQTAEEGGATVFPNEMIRVSPSAGDGIFWFNARGDKSREDSSLHAGCPIYKGNKIIANIFIRMNNQPLLEAVGGGTIPADVLVPGFGYDRLY